MAIPRVISKQRDKKAARKQFDMSISLTTRKCIERLDRVSSLRDASRRWAENQIGRLRLWAATLGVFAPRRHSLEHRLRLNEDMAELLALMMYGLCDTIDSYILLGLYHQPGHVYRTSR